MKLTNEIGSIKACWSMLPASQMILRTRMTPEWLHNLHKLAIMVVSSLMYYLCLMMLFIGIWFCLGVNYGGASSTHRIHTVDHNCIHA